MSNTAVSWINDLFVRNKVPYLICGGFAAFVYGSKRMINDIDIFVPDDYFDLIVSLGQEYISKPAKHYIEEAEGWNVKYVQFKYRETKIEVGSSKGVEIFDSSLKKWVGLEIDFSNIEYRMVYGINIPLMAIEELVNYKKVLARPVDREDIEAINAGV
jgi:hypothetical protein